MKPGVGIYSGTFDPVHKGHIAFALAAVQACGLSKVVFMPEHSPRAKENVISFSHRLELLTLALSDYPGLSVAALDTPQFTVQETLPELKSRYRDNDLTLLLGSDVVQFLHRWPHLAILLRNMQFAIGLRQAHTPDNIRQILQKLEIKHGIAVRYTLIKSPAPGLTSTQVRLSKNKVGLNTQAAEYIKRHGLYAQKQVY